MRYLIAFIIANTCCCIISTAQKPESTVRFAVGLRNAFPVGSFGKTYKTAFGPEVQAETRLSEKIKAIFSVGYLAFKGKGTSRTVAAGNVTEVAETLGTFPVLGGIRLYPAPRYFVGGKFGLSVPFGAGDNKERETGFNYEPHIGANVAFCQFALGYNIAVNDYHKNERIVLLTLISLNK